MKRVGKEGGEGKVMKGMMEEKMKGVEGWGVGVGVVEEMEMKERVVRGGS